MTIIMLTLNLMLAVSVTIFQNAEQGDTISVNKTLSIISDQLAGVIGLTG
jgi:hypothetical protein